MNDINQPHSMEAERSVLGAMIRDPDAVHKAAEILVQQSFYQPNHQTIYFAILKLTSDNTPVDMVSLHELLESNGDIERIGGGFYLAELLNSVTTSANVKHHAEIVSERYQRRRLIRLCAEISNSASSQENSITDTLQSFSTGIREIAKEKGTCWTQKVLTMLNICGGFCVLVVFLLLYFRHS